jgi:protein-disulfide reductase (glutathione)
MSLTTCLEVLVVAVLTLALTPISGLGSESNGLGDHIEWLPLEDGLELAKKENKPLMLIIHKSWCGACKAMKPKFVESDEIAALSKKFVMVNTMDDDEPEGEIYQPDGGYIPRLLFFDPSGDLLKDIINESGNPKYKYYYSDADAITRSMKTVLKQYSSDEPLEEATVEVESDESVQKNGTERIEL